jgi:hypothetical protein
LQNEKKEAREKIEKVEEKLNIWRMPAGWEKVPAEWERVPAKWERCPQSGNQEPVR